MLPRQYLYQRGAGALDKNKRGAHRGADYFFVVVFCVLCGVSKDFSRATLPAPVLERLNSTATVPTVETTTLKTVSVAVTTGGPPPTKETTQPLQTEQATTQVPHSIISNNVIIFRRNC